MSIYQEQIIDHFKHPRNYGILKNPDKQVTVLNQLCGDTISMYASFKNGGITDLSFTSQGCVISKASASLLTQYAITKSKVQLRKLDRAFIIKMLGIELGPNRAKCALLGLEALRALLV